MERRFAIALCLLPLVASLPTLGDPFGNSEESLNAAIWSLGAKNLLELGPSASLRGALVSPHGGTRGDGVYAHHPPLPVWLMTVPVALGGWEGFARLLGLACACTSLWLLFQLLSRSFEPRAALAGLAAAATCVFALRYGRLFTTLTLMTPLYLLALSLSPKGVGGVVRAGVLVSLLVLSSWDGVVAAAVLVALVPLSSAGGRGRVVVLSAVFLVTLAFVVWHLVDATHGLDELLWQFRWRAAGDEVTWWQWLARQTLNVGEGLGPLSLLALLAVPFLARGQRLPLLLLAAPGVVMLVVFRQGAVKHAFWGYNLLLPAAFAVAWVVSKAPRAAWLVAAQALATVSFAAVRLSEEHAQNQLGTVAKQLPRDEEIPVLARGAFHPYVSWYAHSRPVTVRKVSELPGAANVALVDTAYAAELGCAPPAGARWQVVAYPRLLESCAAIADAPGQLR